MFAVLLHTTKQVDNIATDLLSYSQLKNDTSVDKHLIATTMHFIEFIE